MRLKSILAYLLLGGYSVLNPSNTQVPPPMSKPQLSMPMPKPDLPKIKAGIAKPKPDKQEPKIGIAKPRPTDGSKIGAAKPRVIINPFQVNSFNKPEDLPRDYTNPETKMPLTNVSEHIPRLKGLHLFDSDGDEKLTKEEWLNYINFVCDDGSGILKGDGAEKALSLAIRFVISYNKSDILPLYILERPRNIEETLEAYFEEISKKISPRFFVETDLQYIPRLEEGDISRENIKKVIGVIIEKEKITVSEKEIKERSELKIKLLGYGFEYLRLDPRFIKNTENELKREKAVRVYLSQDKKSPYIELFESLREKKKQVKK